MARKPNVVPILVDNMGFSDPAVTGSKIRTPIIDRMARAPHRRHLRMGGAGRRGMTLNRHTITQPVLCPYPFRAVPLRPSRRRWAPRGP